MVGGGSSLAGRRRFARRLERRLERLVERRLKLAGLRLELRHLGLPFRLEIEQAALVPRHVALQLVALPREPRDGRVRRALERGELILVRRAERRRRGVRRLADRRSRRGRRRRRPGAFPRDDRDERGAREKRQRDARRATRRETRRAIVATHRSRSRTHTRAARSAPPRADRRRAQETRRACAGRFVVLGHW